MLYFLRQKNSQKGAGFTLVEMMVAIAVFSLVMVVAMSALLNVIDADKKAQAVKTAINNVNFALESLSKDMRMGADYACGSITNGQDPSGDCLDGGDIIKYRSVKADSDPSANSIIDRKFVYYRYVATGQLGNTGKGRIQRCIEKGSINDCSIYRWENFDVGHFIDITSQEVDITDVHFYVAGADNSGDIDVSTKTQPRMIMTVSGKAGSKAKIETTFDLQTSVSQRIRISD